MSPLSKGFPTESSFTVRLSLLLQTIVDDTADIPVRRPSTRIEHIFVALHLSSMGVPPGYSVVVAFLTDAYNRLSSRGPYASIQSAVVVVT